MSIIRSVVLGCGSFLPAKVVTNDDLAKLVDTSDEWIYERTGIRRRHMVAPNESTADLAYAAAHEAVANARIEPNDIDLIIIGTTTPDETFPSVGTKIQARLGMTRGAAFDVQAACSGFIYALAIADSFIRSGEMKTILLVGAESMTRLLDWSDRSTCVLFGDGAGAIVLQAAPGNGSLADRGVQNTRIFSDGRQRDLLFMDGGPASNGQTGHLRMQGREVFKHAVINIAAAVQASVSAAGITAADVDWFVPHQANKRILDGTAKKLGIQPARVVSTIADHGNTSAASVPLALATAVKDGRIKRGDLVLLEAMGGGFTWGAALIRW